MKIEQIRDMITRHGLTDPATLDAVRSTHATEARDARRSDKLTETGKRESVARSYLRAAEAVDSVREQFRADIAARQAATARAAFGPATTDPNMVIAHRDAFTRAAALTDQTDAQRALSVAALCGDSGLAAAVAHRAHTERWTGALSAYVATRPEAGRLMADLDELNELAEQVEGPPVGAVKAATERSLFGLDTPTEFKGEDRASIKRAAGDDGDAQE